MANAVDSRRLAAAAAFWWERLDGPYRPATGDDPEAGRRALARWRGVLSDVDEAGRGNPLERRLRWDDLEAAAIEPLLGRVELAPDAEPPPWTSTLAELLRAAAEPPDRRTEDRLLDPSDPLPFQELWIPVVRAAARRLAERTGAAALTDSALRDLERDLLRRLCELAAHPLHAELSRSRPAGLSFLAHALPAGAGDAGTGHYRAFVERQRGSGLVPLIESYPVLGRLLAVAVDRWADAGAELLARLETDRRVLEETFGDDGALGLVGAVETGLSDRHRGGRTTAILTFESGVRVVYKPKDLGPDRLFIELLGWCNRHPRLLDMRQTRLVVRDGYGWVEHIDRPQCQDEAAVHRFYRRAGQLLAVVHAVRGTDCHMENLIACGEHPVLVDHETLFFPEPRLLTGERQAGAAERLGSSILTTGFLPQWELREDGVAFDTSGFGEGAGDREWWQPGWLDVNTDTMRRGRLPVTGHDAHLPRLAGRSLSVLDHTEDVAAGFDAAYRALADARGELLAPDGPLAGLEDAKIRFLFRRTAVYARLLERITGAEPLRDGVAYSTELDLLSVAFLAEDDHSHAWPILDAERRALAEQDVPLFFHRASGRDLGWEEGDSRAGTLRGYFGRGSLERVRDSLEGLAESDRHWQSRVLEISFFTRRARKPSDRPLADADDRQPPISDADARGEAERLADEIHATAIAESDGSVSWVGLSFAPRVELYQLESLDAQLYHGVSGLALFLAALHRVTGRRRHRSLALAALRRTLRDLSDPALRPRVVAKLGLGGISGIGSVIYALRRIAALLDEPELSAPAAALASEVTPERIADDRRLDVMSGSAGVLLALLALRETADAALADDLLERAVTCGEHLLRSRRATGGGPPGAPRAWPTLYTRALTGFSHGAAGIAYALLRLWEASGDDRFRAAAEEGLDYERSLYSEPERNWPDLREGEPDRASFMTSWCHGAPGIGLGRLAALDLLDSPEIRREIDAALDTTLRFGLGSIDTLCCGTTGRLDILHGAAVRLERPELLIAARRLATGVVERGRRHGGYRALAHLPYSATPPGLFMGIAGIGYTLLRLVDPRLPSVLAME